MSASDYFKNLIYGFMRGTAMPSPPSTLYVALFNGDPFGGNAVEVTATIRAAGRLSAGFGAPSGGLIANTAKVDFGAAAGNATVTHSALMDAATGGNIYFSNALLNTRNIFQLDPVYFDVNQLTFQLT